MVPNHTIECTPSFYDAYSFIGEFGERDPTYEKSQKHFKMAFILVLRNSNQATQEQKDKLVTIAKNLPEHWERVTRGRSTINTHGIIPDYSINETN